MGCLGSVGPERVVTCCPVCFVFALVMPALPGRQVPSFHDTDMEILLLLYFGVLTIALVALFAVITMRENRGQLFLRDPGGRQGDRPLLCQATPVLPQGGISCSRRGQEGKRKKKKRIRLDNPEPRSSSQMVVLDNVVQGSKTQVSNYGGWVKATLALQRTTKGKPPLPATTFVSHTSE